MIKTAAGSETEPLISFTRSLVRYKLVTYLLTYLSKLALGCFAVRDNRLRETDSRANQ